MRPGLTRRRLLQGTAAGGVLLTAGLALNGLGLWDHRYALEGTVVQRLRCLSAKEYLVLQAVARRVLDGAQPAVHGPGDAAGVDVALWADGYLASMPAGLSRDVRGLLNLLEHSATLLGGSNFTALAAEAQDRVLADWQRSRLALRRQCFQAVKSLCCLAYYQDPRSFAAIGYSGPLVPEGTP